MILESLFVGHTKNRGPLATHYFPLEVKSSVTEISEKSLSSIIACYWHYGYLFGTDFISRYVSRLSLTVPSLMFGYVLKNPLNVSLPPFQLIFPHLKQF